MADGKSEKTVSGKDFGDALQFLVAEQRRIAAKRKKDEQFKKQQNYGYKLKVTLFAIIASGAGMLGAFILHDVLKDSLYGTLEKFIVGDKCGISAVPENAGYTLPASAGSTGVGRSSPTSCTVRKVTARILYSLLAIAIVVPIVIVVSRGKTTAEEEERKRIDTLMKRKKLKEEAAR